MVVLDATIVNIALPSAQHALGFANSDRQWVVTAYALAFGSLLLLGGRLGDMFGRKRVFIIGPGRLRRRLGASAAPRPRSACWWPPGRCRARSARSSPRPRWAPLVSTFRDPRERGQAFGVFGAVAGGGGAVGLILGGVLTQYLSWRWMPVRQPDLRRDRRGRRRWSTCRTSRPAARPRMDWPGTVLAVGRAVPPRLRLLPRRDGRLDAPR